MLDTFGNAVARSPVNERPTECAAETRSRWNHLRTPGKEGSATRRLSACPPHKTRKAPKADSAGTMRGCAPDTGFPGEGRLTSARAAAGCAQGAPAASPSPAANGSFFSKDQTPRGNKCGASAMVQALPHTGPQRGEEQNTRPKLQRKHRRPRCVPFRPGVASACVISALLVPWPSFLSFSFSLLPGSFAALGHLRSRQPHPGCSPYGTTRCPSDHLDI